jgi:hypothetical protein
MMKFSAKSYIYSNQKKEYYDFLMQKFNIELILQDKNKKNDVFFYGWDGHEMNGGWFNLFNYAEKCEIEFYDLFYNVINKKKNNQKFFFPFPETINDFISDCERCKIILYWSDYAIKTLLPRTILNNNDLVLYYNTILQEIGK